MNRISLLLLQDYTLASTVDRLCRIFDYANACLENSGRHKKFIANCIGGDGSSRVRLYGGQQYQEVNCNITDHSHSDLIIIPSLAGHIATALAANQSFLPWIVQQYQRGVSIAALCTGALLLAGTQLGTAPGCRKKWYVSPDFRKEFSGINGVAERIMEEQQAITTTDGAYGFIQQYLEQTAGSDIAAQCTSQFREEFNQDCQSLFHLSPDPAKRPNTPTIASSQPNSVGNFALLRRILREAAPIPVQPTHITHP